MQVDPIDEPTTTQLETPTNTNPSTADLSYTLACRARLRLLLPPPPSPSSTSAHLALDPIIVIPHPGHVHSLAATPCLTYLLTGSSDGYVRVYDFWSSANGKNLLTVQQRGVANLGEGVNKGPVVRGYWKNEVEVEEVVGGEEKGEKAEGEELLPWMVAENEKRERVRVKKMQPVHSMAVQSEGLWAVTGTDVSV